MEQVENTSIHELIDSIAGSNLFLILAFDGGGSRVVLQWKILERILKEVPAFLATVSLFAGTSAGSILASALACGMVGAADKIFNASLMDKIFSRSSYHALTSLNGLTHAKYDNCNLRTVLNDNFGACPLQDKKRGHAAPFAKAPPAFF